MNRVTVWLAALLVALGIGLGAGAVRATAQEGDEQGLLAQEQQLSQKVRLLKAEQRQLLLQKALYSADSKYVELDLRSGEGSLKYRTRILRSFRFTRHGTGPGRGMDGAILSLTAKEDGSSAKRRLLFDHSALVIEGKTRRGGHAGDSLFISISRRDLAAVYYALEAGSFAYMKR